MKKKRKSLMKTSKRPRVLLIFLILLLIMITACETTPVKIDPIKDFTTEYYNLPDDATETQIYQHAIITGKKEINWLKQYIEILINRIKAADKTRIRVLDNREKNGNN